MRPQPAPPLITPKLKSSLLVILVVSVYIILATRWGQIEREQNKSQTTKTYMP